MNIEQTIPKILYKKGRYAILLLPAVLSIFPASGTTDDALQTILKRAPFGPPPPRTPSEAEQANALPQIEEEENAQPRLSETVRLSAMTRFNGVPAAGLTDLTSGRSFFLVEGQTLGGFRLEEVSFESSSVILTKDHVTEPVYLSFADGQPTNLVSHTDANTLNIPNQRVETPAVNSKTSQEIPAPHTQSEESRTAYSPELIAAATIKETDGSTRLSFRELHRLRVLESREIAEREKTERETRAKLEREQAKKKAEEDAKTTELAEQAEVATEKLRRKRIIEAIKDGYDVEINFELTPAEAQELANAGFDIVVDPPVVNEQEEPAHD